MSYLQQAARDKKSLEINDARINIYLLHSVSPRQTSSRITKNKGEEGADFKSKIQSNVSCTEKERKKLYMQV